MGVVHESSCSGYGPTESLCLPGSLDVPVSDRVAVQCLEPGDHLVEPMMMLNTWFLPRSWLLTAPGWRPADPDRACTPWDLAPHQAL